MDIINLNQVAPSRGVATSNFFNGRVLAAEDLVAEQAARRHQIAQLGRAVGSGVAYGLEVYAASISQSAGTSPTNVIVSSGIAVNRRGRPLALPTDVQVALTVVAPAATAGTGLFADCLPPQSSASVVNAGVYVFTIAPASEYEGAVPAVDLSGADPTLSGCGSATLFEGVLFRLVNLNLQKLPNASASLLQSISNLLGTTDPISLSLLRNMLAHLCFGTDQWIASASDFDGVLRAQPADDPFGVLAALRASSQITDCDVPLAVIYWTQSGIGFVDRWAVRRNITPVRPAPGFPLAAGTADALSRAVFSQFQEQIDELADLTPNNPSLAAADLSQLFAYLPQAGLVPVSGGPRGFGVSSFFGQRGMPVKPPLRTKDLIALLRKAEGLPPISVASADLLPVYSVVDNLSASGSSAAAQLYEVFTSRDLHGFLGEDLVADTFQHTWASYSALLQNMILLPKTLTDSLLPLWNTLTTAQQQIVQYAMTREALALSDALDEPSIFQSFSNLYALQKNLATLASIQYPNDPGLADRLERLKVYVPLLDNPPGLQPSIASGNLSAVITAQQTINRLIDTWSGQFAVGQIAIQNTASPNGTVLVAGKTFVFTMSVQNQTQAAISPTVSAAVTNKPTGTWANAVSVRDPVTNNVVSTLSLIPGQLTSVNVVVAAPPDASNNGEPVVVELDATLPLPFPRTFPSILNLTTGTGVGPPKLYDLQIQLLQGPILTNVKPNTSYSFLFQTSFVAGGPTKSIQQCKFAAAFTFTQSAASAWTLSIVNHPEAKLDANNTMSYSFPLSADPANPVVERTTVTIKTPASAGAAPETCQMAITVSAQVPDPTQGLVNISEPSGPYSVSLPAS